MMRRSATASASNQDRAREVVDPASEPEIEWVPVTVVNEHGEKVGPQGMWRPKEQAE